MHEHDGLVDVVYPNTIALEGVVRDVFDTCMFFL
jgi:hypothetical protein